MSTKELFAHYGRQFGTLIGLIGLCLVLWILTPYFLTVSNLLNVAQQISIIAIIAVGMTFVIITAGIDLSVGSVLAFSGMVIGSVLQAGVALPIAIFVGLFVGGLSGIVNGVLITYGRLPPFISTLGMMSVARGAARLITKGRPISGFSESFRDLATAEVFNVPLPVLIMAGVYLVAYFVLARTKLGRYTYAMGGNEEAAILSGVNVKAYKIAVYGLCGMLSGLAAIILTARLNSAGPNAGIMYELDAIAATVIGGTSLMGGEGTITGTLIGALIMGVLRNGLNLLGISSYIQDIVIGAVIILAVLMDMALKRQRN
ncbi:MAG: ribose ABC transporter permease [Nitrosomonadaceae bacterium]